MQLPEAGPQIALEPSDADKVLVQLLGVSKPRRLGLGSMQTVLPRLLLCLSPERPVNGAKIYVAGAERVWLFLLSDPYNSLYCEDRSDGAVTLWIYDERESAWVESITIPAQQRASYASIIEKEIGATSH